ncbi:MAG: NAD(P)/FAD-dependent oxidoreductase [Lentisphaeria bacterium]
MKMAIIIGAGPAGLTAAYRLLEEGDVHPVVLEESSAFGGIARTLVYKDNRMDIGGHRFFSKNAEVRNLWLELMPIQGQPAKDDRILGRTKKYLEGGPDPEKTDQVLLLRDRVSRIFYRRSFFDYPIRISLQTIRNIGFWGTMKAGFSYLFSVVHKRPEKSLEDFYCNRFGKVLYQMFFEDYTEKLWGVHPSRIAPDWGAQRVKGLSLFKAVMTFLLRTLHLQGKKVETSLIESFWYPAKGPGAYWEAMGREIISKGGEIHLGARVVGLQTEGDRITQVQYEKEGEQRTLVCDYLISSMPIKDLALALGVAIPPEVRRIALELPYRDFMTVGLLLNKLKISNRTKIPTLNNIVPDCWIYIQEREVKIGRLQIFNNWSPYLTRDPEHEVWLGLEYFCSEGDEQWVMPDQEFIQRAISELEKIGVIDRDQVLDSVCTRVKKAYPAYFGSYSEFGKVRAYLDTLQNFYPVGRNGQHRYNNMDHSMLTAMEAVRAIYGKGDKSKVWEVNTEEEYHEEAENNG